MRVDCEAWGTLCQVEFTNMTDEVKWVGSFVKGRYGAMDHYRTLPQRKALAQEAIRVAREKRAVQPDGKHAGG